MKRTEMLSKVFLVLLLLVLLWWFAPTRFLWAVTPERIASIQAINQQQDTAFAITDAQDIRYIMKQIRKTPFQKTGLVTQASDSGYHLTFRKENGRTAAQFTIDTQDQIQRGKLQYRCKGESALIGKYLETVEALLRAEADSRME